MTKNADPDKYKYSGYGIGFDSLSLFSYKSDWDKNVIILGADMTSSVQANNKTEKAKVFGQGITELNDKTLTAEANYPINLWKSNAEFCLSLHYNGAGSYLFVNATEIIRFKAKNSELKAYPLCLGNLPKNYSGNDTIKMGLKGSVHEFSVGYDVIDTTNIINIHNYLMKKMAMTFFSFNPLSVNSLERVSMNNLKCKIISETTNGNTNEPNYPKGSCITINDPYAKLCVPDIIKNINVKVFNLISRTNETRNIEWHKTYKCKCRLDASVCNNKQRWSKNKCRCECKELIDKFYWNPRNCECECDKSCGIGELLDFKNCKCRNKIVDKLIEERSKNIDGNEMLYSETLNAILLNTIPYDAISLNTIPLNALSLSTKARNSCTITIVLTVCSYHVTYAFRGQWLSVRL